MMRFMSWRWGFWLVIFRWKIGLLGPADPELFSERHGCRKRLMKCGWWRLFLERDKLPG